MAAITAVTLSTTQIGRYTVEISVADTEVYGSDVSFDGIWISSHAADSYEEALIAAGGSLTHHTSARMMAGAI